MLGKCWAFVVILCWFGSGAEAAGIQLLDSDPRLSGAIWYPCKAEPQRVALGRLTVQFIDSVQGVKDCPLTGEKLPLVIVSHGRGGWFGGHDDVVDALVDAGFVVAAINHPGDNGSDSSQRDSLTVAASRPADMVRLLDFMLNEWKDRAIIDPARIGVFGFSLGGYTGLILAGGNAVFRRITPFCIESNKTRGCEQIRSGDIPSDPPHDPRIRAAVIADPASSFLTRESLAGIEIPLQVWRSELGGGGVDPGGTARVANSLPGQPEIHIVPAGHYAFLPPCTAQFAANLPRLCVDPPGFDRTAFHRDFDASIVRFFREHLSPPPMQAPPSQSETNH
ncbi:MULTISPECIES: dienelactone hydrolase family protein [Rhodopseudomonas]|uniref:alpha/beta hydrolase family protein n=1 Tax=Rhodopseudomonas TaxID=1073 RepID=UPI000696F15D|nr:MULTISPECIES: dienelactone hydrolase family protein [Rhodopseudomonas]MDF3809429.1 prolyl oligopeptidase family serine peptidase [Rhodopseudomonas sp. BAL398]WOK20720.1 prolyl oligopeptidase family serine peptidase [Rhodopseudomonas sp. BAL398]